MSKCMKSTKGNFAFTNWTMQQDDLLTKLGCCQSKFHLTMLLSYENEDFYKF